MSLFVRDEDDEQEQEQLVLDLNSVRDDNAPEANIKDGQDDGEEHVEYPLIAREEEEDLVDQIEPINISLTLPLKFQQLVLEDLVSDDSLLILGKGLGLEPIAANLLHTLSAPATIANVTKRSLVVVLGATDEDNEKFSEELQELSWLDEDDRDDSKRPFIVIKSDQYTADKRQKLYQSGGIMSVTSRIFIVDMLSGIVNPSKITGIVVMHAERVNDLSNESFIVHMYRQQNKWGFIKALTDSAEDFSTGFSPLHRKLKDLRLKKILLWPRFHIEVSSSLMNKDTKSVTEINVMMTESMKHIQTGLLGCLKKCIEELKRKNPTLAIDYWNIENALDPNFLGVIHMILDPNWHRISFDSKQLVKDIKLLKHLLKCLISYDAVDFYEVIQLVLEANKPSVDKRNSESPWLMADESQAVISYAKKRVYENDEYVLEENPKWEQLAILLDDIVIERAHNPHKDGPVLIMCSDSKVCFQLKRFLSTMKESKTGSRSYSGRKVMVDKLQAYLDAKEEKTNVTSKIQEAAAQESQDQEVTISRAFARGPVTSKRRRTRGGAAVAAVGRLLSAPTPGDDIESKLNKDDVEMELFELDASDIEDLGNEDEEEQVEEIGKVAEEPEAINEQASTRTFEYIDRENQVITERYQSKTDDLILQELMPSFIIMYEPDLSFIRRVEVHQANFKDDPARTYFMYYNDSVEEQRHLTAIKKEKEAFTKLIREKSSLASHFETEEDFSKFSIRKSQVMNTRIAGGANFRNPSDESRVLVDHREFRAPLPGLLYRIGLRVVPCMLTVGDYIVTPKVCIERKSIPDLIGSFKSGRLYEQCERMSKYYELPALLIEFDNNQSFSLEPFSETRIRPNSVQAPHPTSSGRMQDEIQMNLAALVLKFPKMKILWSSSPYQTTELIMELKASREEPDIVKAVEAGTKEDKQRNNDSTKSNIITLLQNIPGITNVDLYSIMRKFKDVNKLTGMDREQLNDAVGEDLGERIYDHIQANYIE
ncbi:DNA excision repair protein [Wickerhamomyces ciferrii]|uniref:DNA excision repair protein n=1 Tax=Wickerhamomyces ciferrii (strain ATCC 14091 / BCRC 22168 / CBS 111 / JCM 3599 / NBRC 0793 / NRRL Y-1031 F-60-10) TaxID=1206466 RepID=K0K8A1_WICCF|nr:DNA excision repair protein [Wickerhamomyces ciferrii]CCH41060.1 DNA excision repair protein [Wickerhamomyces ciferrii]